MRAVGDPEPAASPERTSQSQLKASKSWLGALLEHSQDLVTAIAADGQSLFHSPSVERVLGYHPSELEHSDAFALLHPEDLSKVRAVFEATLRHPGLPHRVEYRLKRKDGTYALLEGIGVNLLDDVHVRAVIFNARDLSEQRLKEPMTGLASKMLLLHQLARAQSAA